MKKLFALSILVILTEISKADSWIQRPNLPGDDRGAAAAFSLNGKGYIGTGIKFMGPTQFHNDFWEYDPVTNAWTQKANFGGTARSGAIGFSVMNKGYIGLGYDASIIQQEIWEYDPVNDSWTQKASLPGPGRDYTVAFTIDSFAYVGTGYDASATNYDDFWKYNPVANTWTQKANVGGGTRSSAMAFAVGTKGYIGGGYNATYMDDFWEYNPMTDAWTQKVNIPGGGRCDGVAFVIGNFGYILTGQQSINTAKDLWQYNPTLNSWLQKTDLTGPARSDAVAFSIGNKGYIGTGYDPLFNTLNDFWEYAPDSTTIVDEFADKELQFSVYPSPSNGIFNFRFNSEEYKVAVFILNDMSGKTVFTESINSSVSGKELNLLDLKEGVYNINLSAGNKIVGNGKIIIQK